MICRIFSPGKSFARACQYVTQDQERATVIYQEGVRGHDFKLAARDFEMVAQLHDTVGKPVFHAVLTFHRDEALDDAKKVELALKFLDGVGMVNTQRLVAGHNDARHQHVHLLANRIDYDGNPIHNFPEVLRGRDTVERLIREYALVPVASKDLRQTNFDKLDASDTRKYSVYRSIKENLGFVKGMDELEGRLRAEGIETRYRLDETGQRVGISFLYQNEAFRGSEIDKSFSLRALEKTISQRQELTQWEREKLVIGKQLRQQEERVAKEAEVMRAKEALAQAENQQEVLRAKNEPAQALKQPEDLRQKEVKRQDDALTEKQPEEVRLREELKRDEQRMRPRLRLH